MNRPASSPAFPPSTRPGDEINLRELQVQSKIDRDSEPFRSFAELTGQYQLGRDYEIIHRPGSLPIMVGAWHGGYIEPGSDVLADLIAGHTLHFYAFRALQPGGERHPLRITSSRFDEPRLLALSQSSELVVGVHCCPGAGRVRQIFVGGGADDSVKLGLLTALAENDFYAEADRLYPGIHHRNPCNLGKKLGLQIEVAQSYMDWLLNNPEHLGRLAETISQYAAGLLAAQRC